MIEKQMYSTPEAELLHLQVASVLQTLSMEGEFDGYDPIEEWEEDVI